MLNVPYISQINETSCGIACFEMVFRFYKPSKLSKFSQDKVFRRLTIPTADGETTKVNTYAIVSLARERKFASEWGRLNSAQEKFVEQIRYFTESVQIPLIVCQQWQGNTVRGHFRVVLGVDGGNIVFHDPEPGRGGESIQLPLVEFIDQSKLSPPDVTGGVAIWISRAQIQSPLDPPEPNLWALP